MLTPRDIYVIKREFEKVLSMENALSDYTTITFHYFLKTSSGGGIARHYDNTPLDAWSSDTGFTTTEKTKTVACSYIPSVKTEHNLVQEGYHPDSDIEVIVLGRDLKQASVSLDSIRNAFEFVSMFSPHDTDIGGRTDESITQLWDIVSVRPQFISNQLISVTLGLKLREQEDSRTAVGEKDG